MTLTDLARRATGSPADASAGTAVPGAGPAPAADAPGQAVPEAEPATTDADARTNAAVRPDAAASRPAGREADSLAVASFVLGLVGLLIFNIVLGPTAVVMALLSLARRTRRRGRAFLGLALGVADLVVLAVLVTADGAVAWNIGG
ncbi:hypothetical protein [Streptomyces sp. V2I9]|uniref:hypothetical protein n=1 Tax=Streptomyces sp. V2I9 TaxID=3042304 RepID=UPI0027835D27|nr:hypothetical protein [Streptomyces sp. V2I9]MDQ0987204.1 hypothetical protein [Streptomyces sp. V2I9]